MPLLYTTKGNEEKMERGEEDGKEMKRKGYEEMKHYR